MRTKGNLILTLNIWEESAQDLIEAPPGFVLNLVKHSSAHSGSSVQETQAIFKDEKLGSTLKSWNNLSTIPRSRTVTPLLSSKSFPFLDEVKGDPPIYYIINMIIIIPPHNSYISGLHTVPSLRQKVFIK